MAGGVTQTMKDAAEDIADTAAEFVEEMTNMSDKEDEEEGSKGADGENEKTTIDERKKKLAELRNRMVRLFLNIADRANQALCSTESFSAMRQGRIVRTS